MRQRRAMRVVPEEPPRLAALDTPPNLGGEVSIAARAL